MATIHELCVIFVIVVTSSSAEDLCTNKWNISVDGVDGSTLLVHHSSTSDPGRFTHLVWQWRSRRKPAATIWLSQRPYGRVDGGFVSQARGLFHLPASFKWSLYNNTLRVVTHGDHRELSQYPGWSVSICGEAVVWGVTGEKDLFVNYGDANVTRSLDESWALDRRFRRQAEFPTEPPGNTGTGSTFALWWRRFIDSLRINHRPEEDRPRSWVWDLTELILNLIFNGGRWPQGTPPGVGVNPDAEEVPRGYRDIEDVSDDAKPTNKGPRLL